jgi:hypothetical protein
LPRTGVAEKEEENDSQQTFSEKQHFAGAFCIMNTQLMKDKYEQQHCTIIFISATIYNAAVLNRFGILENAVFQ